MAEVMLDLETIGMPPNGAVLSIGAVRFDFDDSNDIWDEFYANIDLKSCAVAGLSMDPDTIMWWFRQNEEARASLLSAKRPLLDVLTDFGGWISPDDKIWGNGPDFDNVLLANAYRSIGLPVPWKHWNNRCLRTLRGLANLNKDNDGLQRQGIHHNALDDARHQVRIVRLAYQKLMAGNERVGK